MPPEKQMHDSRTVRTRVIWGEAHYNEVLKGLSYHNVRTFKPPTPDIRVIMMRTVEAYLAGKLEPFSGREVGSRSIQRRVQRYTFQEKHPTKKGVRATRSAERPLEMKYLSSVLYHSRDADCETEDWESGEAVKPWITISADDGSAVRLHVLMSENGDVPDTDDGLGSGVMDDDDIGVGGGHDTLDEDPDEEDTGEAVHGGKDEGRIRKKKKRRS